MKTVCTVKITRLQRGSCCWNRGGGSTLDIMLRNSASYQSLGIVSVAWKSQELEDSAGHGTLPIFFFWLPFFLMDLRRAARWPRCNCLRNEHLAQTPIWLPVFLVILNPASLNCRICPVCSQIISWQSPACSASQETIFQAPLSSGLSTESMGSEAEKKEKPLNWVSLSLSLLASFQQLQLTVHRTGLYVMTAISLSASELCELCFLFPCSGLIVTSWTATV